MAGDPVHSYQAALYVERTRLETQLIGMTLTPALSVQGNRHYALGGPLAEGEGNGPGVEEFKGLKSEKGLKWRATQSLRTGTPCDECLFAPGRGADHEILL